MIELYVMENKEKKEKKIVNYRVKKCCFGLLFVLISSNGWAAHYLLFRSDSIYYRKARRVYDMSMVVELVCILGYVSILFVVYLVLFYLYIKMKSYWE